MGCCASSCAEIDAAMNMDFDVNPMNANQESHIISAVHMMNVQKLAAGFAAYKKFNVFNLFYINPHDQSDQRDLISYCFLRSQELSSVPVLPILIEIQKEIQRQKVATTDKRQHAHPPPPVNYQKNSYLQLACHHRPKEKDLFVFLLDNTETFPIKPEYDIDGEEMLIVLHQLCASRDAIESLREYVSSGHVDDRFKNSNCNNDKMRHSNILFPAAREAKTRTPLEVAVISFNIAAVQELCVSKIGGDNFCESVEQMLIQLADERNNNNNNNNNNRNQYNNEQAAIEICQCILSYSSGAASDDNIRTFVSKSQKLKVVVCDSLYLLLGRPTDVLGDSVAARRKIRSLLEDGVTFATAARWLNLRGLYSTLITNRCRYTFNVNMKDREQIIPVVLAAATANGLEDIVNEILVVRKEDTADVIKNKNDIEKLEVK